LIVLLVTALAVVILDWRWLFENVVKLFFWAGIKGHFFACSTIAAVRQQNLRILGYKPVKFGRINFGYNFLK
jgi:hypothetical protein